MTTLEVLICTINRRIHEVKSVLLPPIEGVRYVVSWQQSGYSCEPPAELDRPDVTLTTLQGKGLSRNRNNAISHSTADICLIADDDVIYLPEYFGEVVATFEADRSLDLATFKQVGPNLHKSYPDYSFNLSKPPKGYGPSSIEIAFRREAVAGRLRFNELFGLGAPTLQCGEEVVFLADALRLGLNARYFPKVVARHDEPSCTTVRAGEPGMMMGHGASIYYTYRDGTALPRCVLKAWRMSRQSGAPSFFRSLKLILGGARYVRKNVKIPNR